MSSNLKQLDLDLDILLDEVESRYINSPITHPSAPQTELDLEVDTLLEEINQIEKLPVSRSKHKPPSTFQQNRQQTLNSKCEALLLAGTQLGLGKHSNTLPLACDKIRCTSCDFKIVSIDNRQWTSNVDYLFFRNHMPDKSKLMSETKYYKGRRAYACQCGWTSVLKILDISEDHSLKSKWVCGKHEL